LGTSLTRAPLLGGPGGANVDGGAKNGGTTEAVTGTAAAGMAAGAGAGGGAAGANPRGGVGATPAPSPEIRRFPQS